MNACKSTDKTPQTHQCGFLHAQPFERVRARGARDRRRRVQRAVLVLDRGEALVRRRQFGAQRGTLLRELGPIGLVGALVQLVVWSAGSGASENMFVSQSMVCAVLNTLCATSRRNATRYQTCAITLLSTSSVFLRRTPSVARSGDADDDMVDLNVGSTAPAPGRPGRCRRYHGPIIRP